MARKLSIPLVRKGLRDIGVTTFAGSMLAIVLDKGHVVLALLGMSLGLVLLVAGCFIEDEEGGQDE